jgi:predicted dehydrogenase
VRLLLAIVYQTRTMRAEVNVGLVGLGGPGHLHAFSVLQSGIGHLAAVCDLNDLRRDNFETDFRVWTGHEPPAVRKIKEIDELLADPAIDVIVVALPNFLHYPASLKALQAGKHVLCEKPPTLNAPQMRELHEEASRRGLIYFFGRQMRFDDSTQAARQIVGERKLGEVYFTEAIWIRSRGTPVGIDGWFTDRTRAGGGALIDIGVHAIDTGWFLMGNTATEIGGCPDVSEVSPTGSFAGARCRG